MAVNPNTNATMAGRITAVSAEYPYASAKDESSPGAGDGTPYFLARADDIFGLQQALLIASGIVPTGNADTVLASQYLQAIQEVAAGRAVNFDESGAADVYVLDVRANQQTPAAYFDGMTAIFKPGNDNTGASTVNIAGLGVKNVKLEDGTDPAAGDILAGVLTTFRYDLGTDTVLRLARGEGGPSLGTASVIRTNAQNIAENITFLGTENGSTVGPITIDNTFTVTVTAGSNWVIL